MNEAIRDYFVRHCIDPDNLPKGVTSRGMCIDIAIDPENNIYKTRNLSDDYPKFQFTKNSHKTLFQRNKLNYKNATYICEGEIDTIVLSQCVSDRVVTSTTGAKSWDDSLSLILKETLSEFYYIILDNDQAGYSGAIKVFFSLLKNRILDNAKNVYLVKLGHGDICDTLYNTGELDFSDTFINEKIIFEMIGEYKKKKPDMVKFYKYFTQKEIHVELRRLSYSVNKKIDINGTSVDELKKIPITDFIDVKPGMNNCVFHGDSRPSMVYSDETHGTFPNTLHCFSCGMHADVIKLVGHINNLNFKETCDLLRKSYGISKK